MPQTTTIETVQVVRPIKVLAFVCGILAFILLIVAVASNSWVEANEYNQGLWKVCAKNYQTLDMECGAPDERSNPWLLASGILIIISILVSVVVVILTGIGLWSNSHSNKFKMYKIAMGLMFAGFALSVIALIIFPVMFIQDLDWLSEEQNIMEWYFAWSYGIAWGGAIFQLGCAILLLIDKEEDEIYYKEKSTTYKY